MANGSDSYINASLHGAHAGGGSAPPVRLNRAVLERGKSAGEAHAGGERGGGGRGGLQGFTGGGGEDPGDNPERNPRYQGRDFLDTFLGNALNGGGQLTDRGKKQQAQADLRDQGMALYAQAKVNGASDQQAMQHVVATLGAPYVFAAMKDNKFPLNNSAAWQRYISGNDGTTWKPGPGGRQFQMDPTGKVINSTPIPGVQQPSAQPAGKPVQGADGKLYQPMMAPGGGAPYMVPLQVGPGGAPQGPGAAPGAGGTPQPATQVAPGQQAPTAAPSAPAGAPQPGTLQANGQPAQAGVNAPGSTFQPAAAGKAPKELAAEKAEIQNLQQVMSGVDTAKASVQSQGAFGTGGILRKASEFLPGSSGNLANSLNQAYDTLHATVSGAFSGSNRLKPQYSAMQELIPGVTDSSGAALKKLQNLQNMGRTEIARFAQEYPQDAGVQQLAQQYKATPDYWLGSNGQPGMQQKLNWLTTAPQKLSSNDIQNIYAFEAYNVGPNGATPVLGDNQLSSLGAQMNARHLWGVRDALVAQDPSLSALPDAKTFNDVHGADVQSWAQQHPNQLQIQTIPTTPNPQGQQRQPPASSYQPQAREANQQAQAQAQGQQVLAAQQPQAEVGQRAISPDASWTSNGPNPAEAPRAPSAYDGASFSPVTPAQAGEMTPQDTQEANAGRFPEAQAQQPAAAQAAPSAATKQAAPPGQQAASNAQPGNYKPTSQADALNYNELQSILQQEGKPFSAPVQWQGNSQGGSPAAPGHPMNPKPQGPIGAMQRAQQDFGGPGNNPNGQNAGFTGQPDRSGSNANPQDMVKQDLFGSGGGGEDQMSVNPMSFLQKAFGQGEQLVRDIFGGGGGQSGQQDSEKGGGPGEGTEEPGPQDATGFGSAFATPQQTIPIPPPQPADAGGIGAAFSGAGYGGGL